jgi:aspartate racemase
MKHLGILAHSAEGAALCFRSFCQEGFRQVGPDDHPDVTLDCIALARSMPRWNDGDYFSADALFQPLWWWAVRTWGSTPSCPDGSA